MTTPVLSGTHLAKSFGPTTALLDASVSVAPGAGDFTPDQLQVLLPGDAVGPWRLLAIDGNAAVFQIDGQVRRLAIP